MTDRGTYLVTGASSGIGREISKALLDAGHCVIGMARDIDKFKPANAAYRAIGVDLACLRELPAQLKALAGTLQRLDGVILSAGQGRFGALEEFSYDQIKQLIDVNLIGQIFVVRAFLPLMKRQRRGDLIFIGSEAGLAGGRRGAVYSATKAALRGLAQALRQECAGSGIRVCLINPGMVKTEFFSGLSFQPGEDETNYIVPEDIAETVLYVIGLRQGTVIDEVNLSPLKKVLRFKKQRTGEQRSGEGGRRESKDAHKNSSD